MTLNSNSGFAQVETVQLSGDDLSLPQLVSISRGGATVTLSEQALSRVDAARQCITRRLATGDVFYGINTGFGSLSDVHIPIEKVAELQLNLIRSHACGVGTPLPQDVVRAVMVLRIQTMLRGNSGVRREPIILMCQFLNQGIYPYIPSKGSVGASGDLAPLAHLAQALIGEGRVFYKGELCLAQTVFNATGLTPLEPQAKEGLCLINGTQVMTAIGLLCCHEALNLLKTADIAAAMAVDATRGTATAFRPEIHAVRPHSGQIASARNIALMLTDDGIRLSHANCKKVQDPYSLRCAPQVHGAARNAFDHVFATLLLEANSSTDNPLVFAETDEILSGGNFHGEPVALVLDYLAIAMSEIANISERRIEKLVNPHMSGLPPFLAANSGLNSGFMIPHVVAAALVSENKVYSHPASVDSIPTSAEKEDHVSMGMTSALKLQTIIKNVSYVLAIELITAAQALDFHKPLEGGVGVRIAYSWIRARCKFMETDRSLAPEMEIIAAELLPGSLVSALDTTLTEGVLV